MVWQVYDGMGRSYMYSGNTGVGAHGYTHEVQGGGTGVHRSTGKRHTGTVTQGSDVTQNGHVYYNHWRSKYCKVSLELAFSRLEVIDTSYIQVLVLIA